MKSLTLGLNFFGGHDTSICAIFDDDVYALSEERITRIKHDAVFPLDALHEMLRYKAIDPEAIEKLCVGVATKAFEKRIFNEYAYEMTMTLRDLLKGDAPELYIKDFVQKKAALQQQGKLSQLAFFAKSKAGRNYLKMQFLGKKRTLHEIIREKLQTIFPNAQTEITFHEHHLTHAYATYYASGFDHTLVFTFDGEGDGCFSKLYEVKEGVFHELGSSENRYVENMKQYEFADNGYTSVGNVYSIFTHLLGYTPNADEGKVEALAAFGNHHNRLYDALVKSVVVDETSLSMQIDTEVLNAIFGEENLKVLFDEFSKEDIAAAVQKSTEEIVLRYLQTVKRRYPLERIALAGGVTANVIMNLRIFETLFDEVFIVPAMGDDGISQGAATMEHLRRHPEQKATFRFPMMPYYGSAYTREEVEQVLKESGLSYRYLGEEAPLKAAEMIVEGKIGARFDGRCEFGPRALGNRSIIADVRNKEIQKLINKEIKKRPLFQPFCPSMLTEERERLFEKAYDNKHMTIAFRLKEEFKEQIPGAVHVDLTARVQFVSEEDNPGYYALIRKVRELTGFGVIINTSFNKHGRTMVLTPQHAVRDFIDTNLDFMIIEGFYVERNG